MTSEEFEAHIVRYIGRDKIVSIGYPNERTLKFIYNKLLPRPSQVALVGWCNGTGWEVHKHTWNSTEGDYTTFVREQ